MPTSHGHRRRKPAVAVPPSLRSFRSSQWNQALLPMGGIMIILGVVLLVIGLVTGISILWTIGLILAVIGAVMWILGSMGHAVAGRRHYW